MKKKIVTMTSILLASFLLVGYAIKGVDFWPNMIDEEDKRIMKLKGLGTASAISNKASDENSDKTSDISSVLITPVVTRTPTPIPMAQYDLRIEIYGTEIRQYGEKKTLADIKKMEQNSKVIKVYVNCEYGDYKVVEEVRQALGDKFVEDDYNAE